MFELILGLLEVGLQLWLEKEKNKYTDRMLDLKRRYYEEFNKPDNVRSNAILDNVEFELRQLAREFTTIASTQKTRN